MRNTGLLTALICFMSAISIAQNTTKLSLQEIVKAERAFADYAQQTNIKKAFIKFMAPNGIKFQNGEAKNALQLFEELPDTKSDDLLSWWPIFADISSTNDFGYTYGPWQYFASKTNLIPTSSGIFSSVWQKQASGEWKNLVDLGISFKSNFKKSDMVLSPETTFKLNSKKKNFSKEKAAFAEIEYKYNSTLNQTASSTNSSYFSSNGRIHRPNEAPIIGQNVIQNYIEPGKKFIFNNLGVDMSKAADMAYSYGKVAVNLPNGRKINANYIRIWKKEDDNNWKIVLDVIGMS